jgi:hypothetical protein
LIGAIYLLARKVISIRIPASYILTVAVFLAVYTLVVKGGIDFSFIAAHLCGGGLMLGAWFMATDYVTSPVTPNGKIIFGIFIGLLTVIFRLFGGTAEGVSFAILLGNLVVPLIEKWTVPKSFGKGLTEYERVDKKRGYIICNYFVCRCTFRIYVRNKKNHGQNNRNRQYRMLINQFLKERLNFLT